MFFSKILLINLVVFFLVIISNANEISLPIVNPNEIGLSEKRLNYIDKTFNELVENNEIPGAVIAISRYGKVGYLKAFGMQDPDKKIKMSINSIFRIYSMTKPIVSVGAMMLNEKGKIYLDEKLEKYIPEFTNMYISQEVFENNISKEAIIEANRKIKIHDLLRHTSGFTYGIFGDSYAKRRLKNSVLGKRPLPATMTSNDFVKELSKYPLAYNPGESWEYGRSTDVLGRVIEIASKVSLETYLNENIFSTLNMKDTGFYVERKNFSRIAEPFKEKEPNLIDITKKPLFFKGGHGLVSTVSDYLNFCHMLLNGGKFEDKQVLSKKTVEYMTANHLDNKISRSTSRIPGNGYGFGLGFAVREHDGVSSWPGSKGDFYWLGYGGTYFWIDPKEELIAISMTQSVTKRDKINRLMRNLVYQSINK
tara:strand:- start:3137 stop:4402 length:1266 start_codon:yes stop_codon:yes gene_type:complete